MPLHLRITDTRLPIALPLPPLRSRRTRTIARWFGLTPPQQPRPVGTPTIANPVSLLPSVGQILLIGGPSGAGKSTLLRDLVRSIEPARRIDLSELVLPDKPLADCFGRMHVLSVLRLLSRVGLAEAWTYLRTPDELSDGQRWRLRLAMGFHLSRRRPDAVLVADEFCALLDRVTAAVVARALRRMIDRTAGRAMLASSHDDLARPLAPDRIITCDFGRICVGEFRGNA